MLLLEAIILSVIAASTPLLLAASGELVVERSGVLNLGVEGMMIVGAACGFAGAYVSRVDARRRAVRHSSPARPCRRSSRILTLGLAVNQVAAGLALTILGVGLSGLIGAGFVGQKIMPAPHLHLPVLTDAARRRPHPVRRGCLRLCLDRARHRDLAVSLPHPARPGAARGRRQPCLGARAGLSGAAHPHAGGAVRRRLRRARRRLSAARLYAVLHSRHDRRPRLDRAGAGGVLPPGGRAGWSPAPTCSAR